MRYKWLALLFVFTSLSFVFGDTKPEEKFTGVWKANDTSRYEEVWTIKYADDAWEIKGTYTKDGREVGKAHGTKIKMGKDSLTFTRVFDKKPASDLHDDATATFKITEKGGDFIFRGGSKTSIRKVTREGDAPAAKTEPKAKLPDPKTEPAPKEQSPYKELAQVKASKTLAGLSPALSPDGKRAAMVSSTPGAKTNTVAIWDLSEKKVVQRIRPEGITNRLAWSADGKSLATLEVSFAGADGKLPQLAVWDTATWEQRATFDAPRFAAEIAICANGSVVVASKAALPDDGIVKAWDVVGKRDLFSHETKSTLAPVGVTADGKTVMGISGGQILLFDVATGKPRTTIKGAPERVVLSADGKLLVAASYDGDSYFRVHVWDTASPTKPTKTIKGEKGRIDCMALVDNNRHVIVAGSSDVVYDVDLVAGKIAHSFVPAKGLLTMTLTTTPDSAHLFTLSGDYVARLWSTPYGPKK